MNNMISIFFIGVALSMDAFSLCVGIGTTNINNYKKQLLALLIGLMHFILSQIGHLFGDIIFNNIPFDMGIFNIILFIYLGTLMLIKKDEEVKIMNYTLLSIFILAVGVSIDSFSIGIGLSKIIEKTILASFMFALLSGIISYIGLLLGEKILKVFKEKAVILGALVLFILAFVNLLAELF